MAASTRRYARAFADVVIARKMDPAAATAELQSLREMLRTSLELGAVWQSPAIPGPQKLKLLDAIAGKSGISPVVRNFIAVLIDHGLVGSLDEIARQFQQELDQRSGIARAEVTSARGLEDDQKRELEAKIAAATGKTVRAHYAVDEKILGGVVVKIGSTIYDGSVRGELQRLQSELSAG